VIDGRTFRFTIKNAGAHDLLAIDVDDPKLEPLARLLPELWLAAREETLRAIARRGGHELPGAGFFYDEHGDVEIFIDDARTKVSAELFEELVEYYGRGFSP
jgi:hypothetical protein